MRYGILIIRYGIQFSLKKRKVYIRVHLEILKKVEPIVTLHQYLEDYRRQIILIFVFRKCLLNGDTLLKILRIVRAKVTCATSSCQGKFMVVVRLSSLVNSTFNP